MENFALFVIFLYFICPLPPCLLASLYIVSSRTEFHPSEFNFSLCWTEKPSKQDKWLISGNLITKKLTATSKRNIASFHFFHEVSVFTTVQEKYSQANCVLTL
jgi:hypothetical protein